LLLATVAQHRQRDVRAWRVAGYAITKRVRVADRAVIDCQDHIAAPNACAFGGAARPNGIYNDAFGLGHSQTGSQIRCYASDGNSELTSPDFSVLRQLVHDGARHV